MRGRDTVANLVNENVALQCSLANLFYFFPPGKGKAWIAEVQTWLENHEIFHEFPCKVANFARIS